MNSSNDYKWIRVEHSGGIDKLILNRPDSLNAIDSHMAAEITEYFEKLQRNETVRVVVMSGAGKHFCSGFDLADANHISNGLEQGLRMQRDMARLVLCMRRCTQPIIALVHGAAAGAGFALALAADIRYAAPDAQMNVAMIKIGLTGCDMGISYFLPRAVGMSNAAELMMTGRWLYANRALQIGLLSEVVPFEELSQVGEKLAQEMIATSPVGLRLTKEGLNFSQDAGSLDMVIALEDRAQVLAIGEYMREGVAAFKERRTANFKSKK